jgi:hypothetical protein
MNVEPLRPVVATLQFTDRDSMSNAVAIVRVVGDIVGLVTMVTDGGECETYMSPATCEELIDALSRAVRLARSSDASEG